MQNGEKYWDFVLIARYRWRDKLDLDLTSLRWETGRGWKGDSEKDEELIGPSLGRDNFIHGFDRSFIDVDPSSSGSVLRTVRGRCRSWST